MAGAVLSCSLCVAGPRLQNCEVEHRRAIDGRHVWYTCPGDLRRLVAAAANPAPIDACF